MPYQSIELRQHGIRLYESKHNQGERIHEHYHEIYQILYAVEGEGTFALNGTPHACKQDYVAVIPPYAKHAIYSNEKFTLLVLAFDASVLDEVLRETLLKTYFSETRLRELSIIDGNDVRQILRKMLYEQSTQAELNTTALTIHLSELLLKLARAQEKTTDADANTVRAERLRQYIHTNYFDVSGSNDLAAKLGMSTRHMNTIFKDHYDVTPVQYLTDVRLRLAETMLRTTEKDIASICFEVGFESLSTFYRLFKASANMSPNKYRRMHSI
ncbi:helix-turn-helix transcriptional regulator [Aureibacillus halotolerans]|uniref:AraC-like DNA-binding protein n=1 Tax=Aureibacillus halotolerans TaxID=1508390 RepID=A0A4R6TYB9_9BACI|nr:helix-turn-helix domain-containing protein [Aureibacillus halotolerans]TDQ38316.1 AraC-like DNA-binding protein [Aureibacillus halotolerans]